MKMSGLQRFLKHVMQNVYDCVESDSIIKYTNNEYDLITYKKNGHSSIVIDKRHILKPIIYNDVDIALKMLQVKG